MYKVVCVTNILLYFAGFVFGLYHLCINQHIELFLLWALYTTYCSIWTAIWFTGYKNAK